MPLYARKVERLMKQHGAILVRQKGSHQIWRLKNCMTVLPRHTTDIPNGTLLAIQKQLAPCIGDAY